MSVGLDVRPYKGLAPFDDAPFDALLFFGREREREIIVANLLASRLTVLYGPTGVGKSSLLRAGVAQRLRAYADASVTIVNVWTDDPTAQIDEAIAEADGEVYLILDQIEEYFLYHKPDDAFARRLPKLVTEPGLRVNVLLGIREDALAKLDLFKRSIPNLFANYLRLDHLDSAAGRAAIVGPLERLNELAPDEEPNRAEPELVDAVLEQVAAGRIEYGLTGRGLVSGREEPSRVEAPFLQLVLERLWDVERAAGSRTLRRETLDELGGAETIVRRHLERALEVLDPAQRALAADVFGHLVTPSGTKIAHEVSDLARYAHADEREIDGVLAHLTAERIVRPIAGRDGDGRYEIFHDVLAEGVLAWRNGYEAARELALERRRRRRAVTIAGVALLALAAVAAVALFALAQREQAQDKSRQAQAREEAARALVLLDVDPQRSLQLAVASARAEPTLQAEDVLRRSLRAARQRAVFESLPSAAVVAFDRAGRVLVPGGNEVRAYARTGRLGGSIPLRGASLLGFSDDRALVLTLEGADVVVRAVGSGRVLHTLPHPGAVRTARFSPSAQLVATVGTNKKGREQARVFRVADGELLRLFPQRGIKSVAFSPDSRLLATGSADMSARILRLSDGELLRELDGHTGHVLAVEFSPDGSLLATGAGDSGVRVWEVASGDRLFLFVGHTNPVVDVDWSPDGRFLVDASADRTARIMDVGGVGAGRIVASLLGHRDGLRAVEYSGDGRAIATTSEDGTTRVWDGRAEEGLLFLGRHGRGETRAVHDRTGTLAASVGADGRSRVWLVPRRRLEAVQTGVTPAFVSFDPTSSWVVFRREDGNLAVWGLGSSPPIELEGGAPVTAAVWSPDGLLVSGSEDGTVRRRRNVGTTEGSLTLFRHGVPVSAVAATRGAFASGGADGSVRLWRSGVAVTLGGHLGRVMALAFSPDGSLLATAGSDGVARLWGVDTATLAAELRGHGSELTDVAFSPDSGLVATSSADRDARIWSADSGRLIHVLRGHFSTVNSVSFSYDGRWLATSSAIAAAVWSTRVGGQPTYLRGHSSVVRTAEFSPSGWQVLSAADDGTVRLYRCEVCGGIEELTALALRRLAAARRVG